MPMISTTATSAASEGRLGMATSASSTEKSACWSEMMISDRLRS